MTPHCYLIDAVNQVLAWDVSVDDLPRAIDRQAALLAGSTSVDTDEYPL
jgi:hypothetical protein